MISYTDAVGLLLQFGTLYLTITMCLCLIRAVKGPKLTDRIISINMICIKTILLIATVGVNRGERFLLDIALVYALLSFLAIVVLGRFMIQVKLNKLKQSGESIQKKEAEHYGNS